jgi:protein-S-isoprenylcysteine O-methyltransferase Ste14
MHASQSMNGLFLRAALAFVALPGIVAFLVPWLVFEHGTSFHPAGVVPLGLGIFLLLWCVMEFYAAGRGTLAPWDPPRALVTTGLYRVSRNPMYVAVVLVLCGWAAGFQSRSLAIYATVVAVAFHFRVVLVEEPWLARTFGEQWVQYRERVRRWF